MSAEKRVVMGSDSNYYEIETESKVTLIKARNDKEGFVPTTVTIDGKEYLVVGIGPEAFKDTQTVRVKMEARMLKEDAIRDCLQGSRVKVMDVVTGSAKLDKALRKKYRIIFREEVTGGKVDFPAH